MLKRKWKRRHLSDAIKYTELYIHTHTQGVYMKCVPLYYSIPRELTGTGMKTKRVSLGYVIKPL
jgi:hypothetical protein